MYRCLPELWLRKTFPGTVFVNTDMPDSRIRMRESNQQLSELDDDSTEIYYSNIIERYSDRPNVNFMNGIYRLVDKLCLAEFAAYYYKPYKCADNEENDNQPSVLTDEVLEHQNEELLCLIPEKIKLMTRKEIMKCRKIKAVLRFHTPQKTIHPEKYFHHLLMLYFSWRQESELIGPDGTYASKFADPFVKTTVERNRGLFEPYAEAVDEALEYVQNNPQYTFYGERFDSFAEQENSEMVELNINDGVSTATTTDKNTCDSDILPSASASTEHNRLLPVSTFSQPNELQDDDFLALVRSLNKKQRDGYEIVLSWCRNKMKSLSVENATTVDPIHMFFTGGAGTGKSHLIRAIYQTACKTFKHSSEAAHVSVLLAAPTGVAAVNIGGATINTALAIPKNVCGDNLGPLSDQRKSSLRCKLCGLKLIIIDEVSMISNVRLKHIHERLAEVFGTPSSLLFAGISVIVVGDFYQLAPIKARHIFSPYKNEQYNLCHPWDQFKMIELTEIMRQIGDICFSQILSRIRVGNISDPDIQILSSRFIQPTDPNYPFYTFLQRITLSINTMSICLVRLQSH